jgi:histidyl-tRNA synthetase
MVAPVKGFRDIEGKEAQRRIQIREIIEKVFRNYNYSPVETPVIEDESFVRGENTNDEAVSDIFKLQDRGERKLALRYEFTFQLKRLAMLKKLPYKRYEIGYVFRDEPTGGNRWKQFTQCDVDIVGSSVKDEAEVLAIAKEIFEKLGIKVTININNRKLLNEILQNSGIKENERLSVIREIDKLDKLSESEVKTNLKKYGAEKILELVNKNEKDFEKYENYKLVRELKEECKLLGVEVNFVPFLARGLSYYNGSIYEIKTSEMKETISAGGSYLVNEVQATGISFGLDRLEMLAKIKEKNNKVLIISIGQDKKSIQIAQKLRQNNIPCTILYGKISKALEYANSYEIKKAIFVGEEEIKKKKFKIRDLSSGEESFASEGDLVKNLS